MYPEPRHYKPHQATPSEFPSPYLLGDALLQVVAGLQDADVVLSGQDGQAAHLLDPLALEVDGAQDVLAGEEFVVQVAR